MLINLIARQPSWLSNGRSPVWYCLAAVLALSAALRPSVSRAATAAYWRMEEGTAGSVIPPGADTVTDSSGNANHMRTFDPTFTSPDYTTSVSPLALRSGLPNTLALNFGPGGVDEDRFQVPIGRDDDIYTQLKPIDQAFFTAMTVELAFKMDTVSGFQALFGEDGKPLGDAEGEEDRPEQPFAIKVRGDDFPNAIPNQLQVEWIDGDGVDAATSLHHLASGETIVPNIWYHVAFTLSATDAQLWIAKTSGDYELKDSITGDDFAGPSGEVTVFEPLGYTIGRGMFGNGITDWSDATIDEVRVSDTVLTPAEFVFVPAGAGDADFNDDNIVNGADFIIWQKTNGGAATPTTGDANGDGQSNAADLGIWKTQFGGPPVAAAASGAVPEPTSFALLLAALAVVSSCRRVSRA